MLPKKKKRRTVHLHEARRILMRRGAEDSSSTWTTW